MTGGTSLEQDELHTLHDKIIPTSRILYGMMKRSRIWLENVQDSLFDDGIRHQSR
jgi:hypothetical protein